MGKLTGLCGRGLRFVRRHGMLSLYWKVKERRDRNRAERDYESWLLAQLPGEEETKRQRETEFAFAPLVSILVPAYETPEPFLRQLMDSVLRQSYGRLELCIADGSPSDRVERIAQGYARRDSRVRYRKLSENLGISGNTNAALELASGQLLDDYLQSRFLQPLDIRASLYAGRMAPEEVAVLYGSGGTILRTRGQQAGQTVPTEIGAGSTYYPGGLTISAKDLAKLVSVLANDGAYQTDVQAAGDSDVAVSVSCLSPESVEAMETAQFSVTPENGTAPFDQCLVLRHQEDLLGRDQLYYHTGNAYGVYSLLTYDPDTGDGVVVITTGAAYRVDDRGLYELPAQLSQALYAKMEEHDG